MKITESLFSIVDVETTGFDPAADKVVEVAARTLSPFQDWRVVAEFESLVDPERPIPPDVSAVHHLIDEDVRGGPTLEAIAPQLVKMTAGTIVVAHHAEFDCAFLPMLTCRRWLCSKRLAQHVLPDAPNHKNQTLRYVLGHARIDLEGGEPHRAMADVIVTAKVFASLIERYLAVGGDDDVDELIALAESPVRARLMSFGKWAKTPMSAIPLDYFEWALGPRGMTDLDPDLAYSMRCELRERGNGRQRSMAS